MLDQFKCSPCLCCPKGRDPQICEDKHCSHWRSWFLARWELLRQYPRQIRQREPEPVGVMVGGNHYAAPHQVRQYLETDPCTTCCCDRELCKQPCRIRMAWDRNRKEIIQ